MKAIVFVVRVDQTKWFRSIKKYPNSFEVFKGGVWDNHQPLVLIILMLPRPNYLYNHFVSSIFCPNPRYISPVAELLYFHCASLFRFSNFFLLIIWEFHAVLKMTAKKYYKGRKVDGYFYPFIYVYFQCLLGY